MAGATGERVASRVSEAPAERPQRGLGRVLLTTRWLLAPIFFGLLASVILLVVKFVQKFIDSAYGLLAMSSGEAILNVLQLVDIALVANLVLIVAFAGWQTVIGPLLGGGARSEFTGLGFSAVKLRLIASIVSIAAIQLLETFMHVDQSSTVQAMWQLAILLGMAVTGTLLALIDKLSGNH